MASVFREFSATYRVFQREFPEHPIVSEIQARIAVKRAPQHDWLKTQTRKMKLVMKPIWKR